MALQPSLAPLVIMGDRNAPHTLDVFLDYVCPFSKKLATTLDQVVKPLLAEGGEYAGKAKVIFRNHPQPWHASSTFVHEASLALVRIAPLKFWAFSLALFDHQDDYFDQPTSKLTPDAIRNKLADLAVNALVIGKDDRQGFLDLLTPSSTPNGGVAVTDDLKYTMTSPVLIPYIPVKFGRQNGIHVSPTVLLDGLVANEISSSWDEGKWKDFFASKLV
ncbi:hypothetical protein PHLCEN_2v10701 [Hermanssonia centrifuga]|uniref:Uncharacterized protein n=1 Tax=Hermanssonia centrifuga TaxID=98765 RepID=A0A2R6NM43_9APHY|nr:hypothetical protein PHLCEN_2v10701 [Hermanssonia centrifuga]